MSSQLIIEAKIHDEYFGAVAVDSQATCSLHVAQEIFHEPILLRVGDSLAL
jgi:hypothetical protein